MIFTRKNGLSFYRFPNLVQFPQLRHGIFLRTRGKSKKPYDSLNVSLSSGDDPQKVRENRELIAKAMGGGELLFFNQIHGDEIAVLEHDYKYVAHKKKDYVCDAVVTSVPGKNIVIQVADCQAVMAYSPKNKVIANIHSGWRGSIKNIIGKTIKIMKKEFDVNPSGIYAGIGPSLGPCCGEFINYKKEIPEKYRKYKDDHNHFDFWSMSVDQLMDAGVPFENIHVSEFCTKCRTDLFFSYRGEGLTGRFAAVIGII